jgi:hypothetical protein
MTQSLYRAALARALRTRWGAFALAMTSILLMAGGVLTDGWMSTLPSNVIASCTADVCTERPNPAIQLWLGLVLVALGVGLMVAAWKLDRRPGERSRQGWTALRAWGNPLLWLAVLPVVAVPLTLAIAAGAVREPDCKILSAWFVGPVEADCPVATLLPSVLIPGLLNLVPLRWLWARDPRPRMAAITASVIGIAALLDALGELVASGPVVYINVGLFALPYTPPGLLSRGVVFWLAALIALLVIAKLPAGQPAAGAKQARA